MVATHGRDLPGMKNVGPRTDFFEQPGTTLYPNVAKPDFVMNDLLEFVKRLRSEILYKKKTEPSQTSRYFVRMASPVHYA